MNQPTKVAVPAWYWVVAVLALLWNLMGCVSFLAELFVQDKMMETMTAPQKEWVRSIPSWMYVDYGIAVVTGTLGAIGLLLRKSWAMTMFAISLVAVIVQMVYSMIILGGLQAMGPTGLIMPIIVTVLAIVLFLFSRFAKKQRMIN